MASLTKFDICTFALALNGCEEITSFDDGRTESDAARALYEPTVVTLLGGYPWTFSTRTELLERSAEVVPDKWDAAYPLPADYLLLRSVRVNDEPIQWGLANNQVLCNADPADLVYAEITYRVSEAEFPGYFLDVIHMKLASLFASAITRKSDNADYFRQQYELAAAKAQARDSQSKTSPRIKGRLFLANR